MQRKTLSDLPNESKHNILLKLLAAFILLAVCCTSLACSSSFDADFVEVKSFYGGASLRLDLKVVGAFTNGESVYFDREESLDQLKSYVENISDDEVKYEAEIFDGMLFVVRKSSFVSYFMIKELKDNTRRYGMSDMTAYVGSKKIICPYQYFLGRELISADENKTENHEMTYRFSKNIEAEISCSFEEFAEFYSNLSRSDITVDVENKTVAAFDLTFEYINRDSKNFIMIK